MKRYWLKGLELLGTGLLRVVVIGLVAGLLVAGAGLAWTAVRSAAAAREQVINGWAGHMDRADTVAGTLGDRVLSLLGWLALDRAHQAKPDLTPRPEAAPVVF